ncbi:hypothetical protein FQV27_17855 [Paracoccus aurantiacus]|uniref:Transmembrane protein n=1 Tax=Paracoccus aurantiacus TaxID=2599412 RepID=A0A5C6RRB1_9RHOB|nr:hypothetical protein FQV27_17855 [Paracoccus aurantiacus]
MGRPVDSDGCPHGPWTPEMLAEAISQIDANRNGIELRTVQLWFKDNEKGISTNNIRWLARVLGCNDPEGTIAWQAALIRSQARLTERRRAHRENNVVSGSGHDMLPDIDGEDSRHGLSIARVTEAIFSHGSLLNLPAWVFAGAVALQFSSYFLTIHSVSYVREDGITKEVGFLWAPNWTIVFLVLMPVFFGIVADQVTTWKTQSRPTLVAYINEHDRDEGWIQKIEASSYTYWVALLLCLGFAGVFQWVSVRLLPVLQGSGAIAIDWGSVAFVQPDNFGVVEQAVFTGAAYLYMSLCFYLFIAGLILLCNLADDFAHIGKALGLHPKFMSLNGAHAAVSRIMRGIVRASIFGLMVAVCMKLQSLYLVTTAPSVWQWLLSDFGSAMSNFGTRIDWGDYSMPTHYTSLLVVLMVCTAYIYATIRINTASPFQLPLVRPTTAVLLLGFAYLLTGAVSGFSVFLAVAIVVTLYGFFDPDFGSRSKGGANRQNVL